ncbi:MAG: hypothetical protein ACTSYA_03440 [Candidatus Kariarchaeaceae archaeon]
MAKKPTKITINGVVLEITDENHLALVIDKIIGAKIDLKGQKIKTESSKHLKIDSYTDLLRLTLKERVGCLVRNQMSGWFTSSELCLLYEESFGERLLLSTAGTYLSRLYEEGLLERDGSRSQRLYCTNKHLERKYPEMNILKEEIIVTELEK